MISIKITGLLDIGLLKKLNQSIVERNNFWNSHCTQQNTLTYITLLKGLQSLSSAITEQDVKEYI